MDIEKYSESVLNSKNAGTLRRLSESENGRRVADMLDEQRLKQAMQTGDSEALAAALKKVLSTPEGRALAADVKKAVDGQ